MTPLSFVFHKAESEEIDRKHEIIFTFKIFHNIFFLQWLCSFIAFYSESEFVLLQKVTTLTNFDILYVVKFDLQFCLTQLSKFIRMLSIIGVVVTIRGYRLALKRIHRTESAGLLIQLVDVRNVAPMETTPLSQHIEQLLDVSL